MLLLLLFIEVFIFLIELLGIVCFFVCFDYEFMGDKFYLLNIFVRDYGQLQFMFYVFLNIIVMDFNDNQL